MSDKVMGNHYRQLIGHAVVGICCDNEDSFGEATFGLVLMDMRKGSKTFGEKKIAWISADPEGNRPGFLDIQPAD